MKSILFVCVHNAGRSQMAEGLLNAYAVNHGLEIVAASAGTVGSGTMNPVVVEAMEEIGISLDDHFPKQLTKAMADNADLIVSMGCGVDAEMCPVSFLVTEDWGIEDPAGQSIEKVRIIRDLISDRVEKLVTQSRTR